VEHAVHVAGLSAAAAGAEVDALFVEEVARAVGFGVRGGRHGEGAVAAVLEAVGVAGLAASFAFGRVGIGGFLRLWHSNRFWNCRKMEFHRRGREAAVAQAVGESGGGFRHGQYSPSFRSTGDNNHR
jgi:hypothetical protein